jgi:hypothetical protein
MIKRKEYTLTVNSLNRPEVLEDKEAIAMLLVRLILLEPGSDPLHPEMGVGIVNYRYAMGRLEELKKRVEEQINQYLPCFPTASVKLEITDDKLCNILITIADTVFTYDSKEAPIPITIDTAATN